MQDRLVNESTETVSVTLEPLYNGTFAGNVSIPSDLTMKEASAQIIAIAIATINSASKVSGIPYKRLCEKLKDAQNMVLDASK
jgi:hypothetical protein